LGTLKYDSRTSGIDFIGNLSTLVVEGVITAHRE
jgi:hypothetical protein